LLQQRGKRLKEGLAGLLKQIEPKLDATLADQISHAILAHPLVADGGKLSGTLHREEFTQMLLELGASDTTPVGVKVREILTAHGIEDPGKTLENVRSMALQIERSNPELAADVRHTMALMSEVKDKLLGKVHGWFDQTIDRVADRFTSSTRVVTVVCSLAVALALQLDVIGLVNRLSEDPELRRTLVAEAIKAEAAVAAAKTTPAEKETALKDQAAAVKGEIRNLASLGVLTIPSSWTGWWDNWGKVNVLGTLLSALLLSLGAPFWYNALKNLLKLRSVIAYKDDDQRTVRQTTQALGGGAAEAAPAKAAAAIAGERGVIG